MSNPVNLKPYTMVTVFGDAGSHRLDFNGELVQYYTTWEGDIEVSPNGLADLLNAAYQKGVETERACIHAELAHEFGPHGLPGPTEWAKRRFAAITPDSGMTDELKAAIQAGFPKPPIPLDEFAVKIDERFAALSEPPIYPLKHESDAPDNCWVYGKRLFEPEPKWYKRVNRGIHGLTVTHYSPDAPYPPTIKP